MRELTDILGQPIESKTDFNKWNSKSSCDTYLPNSPIYLKKSIMQIVNNHKK